MSKIGKLPVAVAEGVHIALEENSVVITGPKGSLSYVLPRGIEVRLEDSNIQVLKKASQDKRDSDKISALLGLSRSILANMVQGVSSGFEKKLELSGVGYRAVTDGSELTISVGFSHPVKIKAEPGINFAVSENVITVLGADKSLVGNVSAKIRSIRPPEPYKGKGIAYKGERIRRKVGKAAKAVGAK